LQPVEFSDDTSLMHSIDQADLIKPMTEISLMPHPSYHWRHSGEP
jgi:hypothetical protein